MRVSGWENLMYEAIEDARHKEYEVGVHDCALFAIRVLQTITGTNYGKGITGEYNDKRSSLRLVAKLAGRGKSLLAAVSKILDVQPVNILKARRGDPVLYVDDSGVEHVGICVGSEAAVLAEKGLLFVSLAHCSCAWST